MRRALLLLTSLLVLLATAAPVAAATEHFRYKVHGSGAWASGVIYLDGRFEAVWIEIGDEATDASDGQTYLRYVLFEHLLETCDDKGCVQTYTAGWAEDVPFTIDRKKLATASVDVEIPAIRCVEDATSSTCFEVSVPVTVQWSGYGPFIRSHGTSTGGIAGEYQYTLNGAATERWATVTGTVAGMDLEAAGSIGALYKTRVAERSVTHP